MLFGLRTPTKNRGRAKEDANAGTAETGARRGARSPYSSQYETIVSRGHTRPTTSIGAPTLVWHVGVWPRRKDACDPHDTADCGYDVARAEFARRRRLWLEEIDGTLEHLEKTGRLRRDPDDKGRPKRFLIPPPDGGPAPLVDTASVGMELWWRDTEGSAQERLDNALRVRLQVDLTSDYATYCFYIDVGQTWSAVPHTAGVRRRELLQTVERIQDICRSDRASAPDVPTPPNDLDKIEDTALLDARNLLFVRIWEQFTRDMSCDLSRLAGRRGEVFANFRRLVMPSASEPASAAVQSAGALFAKFSRDARFDADGPEANATIKAYWPLARRITPAADYREFIACGVMNWRALYITALGASSQRDLGEDRPAARSDKSEPDIGVREEEVAGKSDSSIGDDRSVWKRLGRDGFNHPVRYLLCSGKSST
jgi:hypothetical protein